MRRAVRLLRELGPRARGRGVRAHSSSAGASSRVSARGPNGVGFGPSDDAIRHVGTLTILSGFGFAASSLLVASTGVASMDDGRTARGSIPPTAFGENVSVDPATLKQLARDIAGAVGSDDDDDVERTRTRALRILARVTLFVDYHDDIIAVPEIASALIRCLEHSAVIANDPGSVGTHSTALSLQCLADLAKERTVREAIVKSQGALIAIPAALDAANPRGALDDDTARVVVVPVPRPRPERFAIPRPPLSDSQLAVRSSIASVLAHDRRSQRALLRQRFDASFGVFQRFHGDQVLDLIQLSSRAGVVRHDARVSSLAQTERGQGLEDSLRFARGAST